MNYEQFNRLRIERSVAQKWRGQIISYAREGCYRCGGLGLVTSSLRRRKVTVCGCTLIRMYRAAQQQMEQWAFESTQAIGGLSIGRDGGFSHPRIEYLADFAIIERRTLAQHCTPFQRWAYERWIKQGRPSGLISGGISVQHDRNAYNALHGAQKHIAFELLMEGMAPRPSYVESTLPALPVIHYARFQDSGLRKGIIYAETATGAA